MSLERIMHLYPAWDRRDSDPNKNYGVHCVELLMLLRGDEGAVQFRLFTGWHLPAVIKGWTREQQEHATRPMPADLGYHSPRPLYEGQSPMDGECQWLNCGACFYDGSTLNAGRIFSILLTEGEEGVWRELENYYRETFSRAEVA